jgi:DeoR family transcriptional regulator, fructose operon transcriptional repressor
LFMTIFVQNYKSKMSLQSRKQKIVNIVEQLGEASVTILATQTDSSEATIRRDLIALSEEGLIYRTHGGAMKLSLVHQPVSFTQKAAQHLDKKDYICQLAAKEINDGDVILMDCGSTVFRLCQFIKNKRIRVITNSLPVVAELLDSEVSVNLIGGEIDKERQAVHGWMATEHLKRYQADKAFLGVDGLSATGGLMAKTEKEVEITLAMMRQAKYSYLLCDSSKIGRESHIKFADCSSIHALITDANETLIQDFKPLISNILN